jgi:hypothetical protein
MHHVSRFSDDFRWHLWSFLPAQGPSAAARLWSTAGGWTSQSSVLRQQASALIDTASGGRVNQVDDPGSGGRAQQCLHRRHQILRRNKVRESIWLVCKGSSSICYRFWSWTRSSCTRTRRSSMDFKYSFDDFVLNELNDSSFWMMTKILLWCRWIFLLLNEAASLYSHNKCCRGARWLFHIEEECSWYS